MDSQHSQYVLGVIGEELLDDLKGRISLYWLRGGARQHWWQRSRDPLDREDEILLARAEWLLAKLLQFNRG